MEEAKLQKELNRLEIRVNHLEGILSALLMANYPNLVGGKEWAERCIKILES